MTAWLLVLHLLGVVFWIGSLLIVTRIFAVHTEESSADARQALTRLEKLIFNRMTHPAAAVVVLAGISLIFTNPHYYLRAHWLHAKLLLVLLMIGLDLWLYVRAGAFHAGRDTLRRGECMAFHGTIAATLLAVLILVLVKPF